jgi:hypothetical protein
MILFLFFSGVINMSHVLQRQDMDQELELVEGKGGGAVLGKVGLNQMGIETPQAFQGLLAYVLIKRFHSFQLAGCSLAHGFSVNP